MATFKLDIHNPCTAEEIQELKRVYTRKSQLNRIQSFLNLVAIVVFFVGVVRSLSNDEWAYTVLLGIALLVVMFTGMNTWVNETVSPNFEDIPDSSCGSLMEACAATPEGLKYREAVLAQGRKFVVEEASLIINWMDGKEHRLACKELYGIPANNS